MGRVGKFSRGLGSEIARGLCEWERRQYMSESECVDRENKRREMEEKRKREAFKRSFGVYPNETWRW
jgi:hypothetical protein